MKPPISKLILPVLTLCSMTAILGPAPARAGIELTMQPPASVDVIQGQSVALQWAWYNPGENLSGGDAYISRPGQLGPPTLPAGVTFAPFLPTYTQRLALSGLPSGGSTSWTLTLSTTQETPVGSEIPMQMNIEYQSATTPGLYYTATSDVTVTVEAAAAGVPEPDTLTIMGLGGGCWIVYAVARKRRNPGTKIKIVRRCPRTSGPPR